MATTIINGAFANPANTSIWIEWSESVDTDNNASTLTAILKIKKTTSYNVTQNSSVPYSLSISGSVVKSGTVSVDFSGASVGTVKTICTYTKTYTHNSDGTLGKKSISGVVDLSVNNPGKGLVPASGASTAYVSFTTIPRGCDLTSYTTSANIGTAISVTIDRKSSSFTHTATISLSGSSTTASATFDDGTGSNTKTITIPTAWASVITGTSSSNCVLTVTTTNSGSTVGTITKKFTTTIPSSSYSPSIDTVLISAVNPSPISTNTTVYINTKTSPKITVDTGVKTGATMEAIRIKASDGSYDNTLNLTATTATSFTLPTITSTTSRTYTLTVTDSRGFSASKTTSSITIQDYNPPSLTSFTAVRCSSDKTTNSNGTYVKVLCTYTYSSCGGLNSASCTAKLNSGTASTVASRTETLLAGTLSTSTSGTVTVTFGDIFTSAPYTKSIGTLTCPIDIAPNNKGIAIGGISQEDGYFDIYSPMKTRDSLVAVKGIIVGTLDYDGTTSYDSLPIGLTTTYNSSTLNGFPTSTCTVLTVNYSSYRQFQIASQYNGKNLHYRAAYSNNTGGTGTGWSAWTRIYTDNNPPSASDVGAYSKTEVYAKSEVYPKSDWNASKNLNGYCKLPTGIIIQWGYASVTPTATSVVSSQTVTFPIAFPAYCRSVQVTPNSTVPDKLTSATSDVTASGFTIYMTRTNTTSTSYYWFAVGY